MQSSALNARLQTLSVHSVSKLVKQAATSKSGYICRLQTRISNSQQEEPFFTIHWAVLQNGCLLLYDSSISQSCSEAIYLTGFSLEPSSHPALLWPDFCDQQFQLSGPNAASTWHLGCSPGTNWQHHLRTAIVAATFEGNGGLNRLLDEVDDAQAQIGIRQSRPPPPPVPMATPAAAAIPEPPDQDNTYNECTDEAAPPAAGSPNPSPPTTPPQPPLWLPPPPQIPQKNRNSTAVQSVYDLCTPQLQPQSLHSLASSGLAVSFALDYVAAAVYTGTEADEDSLWQALSETDPGTFLLSGYSKDQPGQATQIAVKTNSGFEVKCLQIVSAPLSGVSLVGEFGRTFDTVEQLVFHYHLFPIVRDGSGSTVRLSAAFGYENSTRIPVRTMLFSSCFWSIGDKDVCSKVLFESTQGTYSLRAGSDANYVLSVRAQNVVAKLVIKVVTQGDSVIQFFLANAGPSGPGKFGSLEDLLASLHSSSFPVTLAKTRMSMTLQTPYQTSAVCKAKQQSMLLDPLRQQIFHRGMEELATRALRLPSTLCGAFIVWLTSATEVCLMVRGQGQRVFVFTVVCRPTGCRALPERSVYLEKWPDMKFDSIEALVAHLQCNSNLLMPELPGTLNKPVNCRDQC